MVEINEYVIVISYVISLNMDFVTQYINKQIFS
jgi:hypothetical protein